MTSYKYRIQFNNIQKNLIISDCLENSATYLVAVALNNNDHINGKNIKQYTSAVEHV